MGLRGDAAGHTRQILVDEIAKLEHVDEATKKLPTCVNSLLSYALYRDVDSAAASLLRAGANPFVFGNETRKQFSEKIGDEAEEHAPTDPEETEPNDDYTDFKRALSCELQPALKMDAWMRNASS